jgi:hypothetical protein
MASRPTEFTGPHLCWVTRPVSRFMVNLEATRASTSSTLKMRPCMAACTESCLTSCGKHCCMRWRGACISMINPVACGPGSPAAASRSLPFPCPPCAAAGWSASPRQTSEYILHVHLLLRAKSIGASSGTRKPARAHHYCVAEVVCNEGVPLVPVPALERAQEALKGRGRSEPCRDSFADVGSYASHVCAAETPT